MEPSLRRRCGVRLLGMWHCMFVDAHGWEKHMSIYIYIHTHKSTAHIGRIEVNVTDLWWLCHSVFLCTGVSQCTFTIQENPNQLMTHYWKELASDAKYTQCFIRCIFLMYFSAWLAFFSPSLQYRSKGRPRILLQAHFYHIIFVNSSQRLRPPRVGINLEEWMR